MSNFQKPNAEQQNNEQQRNLQYKPQRGNRTMPENSVNMLKGGNFYFDVTGYQVRVWFSSFSGKEEIYVDDKLVSSNRSWRKMGTHNIKIAGQEYKIRVGVRNWSEAFKSIYVAELYREGQLIDQDEIILSQVSDKNKTFSWRKFGLFIGVALVLGGFTGAFIGYVVGRFFF